MVTLWTTNMKLFWIFVAVMIGLSALIGALVGWMFGAPLAGAIGAVVAVGVFFIVAIIGLFLFGFAKSSLI